MLKHKRNVYVQLTKFIMHIGTYIVRNVLHNKSNTTSQLEVKKIALEPSAQASLTTKFTKKFQDDVINKTSSNSSLNPVSALLSKGDEIYEYDITPPAEEFVLIEQISQFTASSIVKNFNFSTDSFSDIKGIVLNLTDGNDSLFLYQHTYQVSLHKKVVFPFEVNEWEFIN